MTASDGETISTDDEQKAIELAQGFAGLKGMDLAKECCTTDSFEWTAGTWDLSDTLLNRLPRDRLDIGGIRHDRIGHDGRRVWVDQDDTVAFFF